MDDLDILSDIPIFAPLDEESRKELACLCTCCDYQVEEILFRQGDPASAMSLVLDGEVTMSITMLDGSPRSATAKITRHTKLLRLRRQDFVDLLGRQPKLAVAMLSYIATRLRTTNEMFAHRAARNVNEEIDQRYSFADRVADHVAEFGGSWWFIASFGLIVAAWMMLNGAQVFFYPFDPFPYIFLNLVLNVICAVQALIIIMSQNRQGAKDRLAADLDYQLNLKLEMQLQDLHLKVDELVKQSNQRAQVQAEGANPDETH